MLPFEELPNNYPFESFRRQVEEQPYPLVFVTICGPHLLGLDVLGCPYELRGVHVPILKQLYGRDHPGTAIENSAAQDGVTTNLVTNVAKTFFGLIVENNGEVLEQLFSPLVVHTTPQHDELKTIASRCITSRHAQYYLSLAETQWNQFCNAVPTKVEPLLHVYRLLLTGIHLMRTGQVQSNLHALNQTAQSSAIDDMVDLWLSEPQSDWLDAKDLKVQEQEYKRLVADLASAATNSALPEQPSGYEELNALLPRLPTDQSV